ncbi:UNVERIFIED_ORG: hypothetical protein FHR35_008656 [Microbispora rosea subsp. rosea]
MTPASGGNGAGTAMPYGVHAEVDQGRRDLISALDEYQHDLLERGNTAVEAGKRARR